MSVGRAARAFRSALVLALIGSIAGIPPVATHAADAGDPPLPWVHDAPFVRTQEVLVGIVEPVPSMLVTERLLANDDALTDGILEHGVPWPVGVAPWVLADGADGDRTIYAQIRYGDGSWSPVGSLTVTLDRSPRTSLVLDASPLFRTRPGTDTHVRMDTPADAITGLVHPTGGAPNEFGVSGPDGAFGMRIANGPIVPGTYEIPASTGQCDDVCVHASFGGDACEGEGTVTIHAITLTPDSTDLATLAADIRFVCFGLVVAGSIRYGSDMPIKGLDQSADKVFYEMTRVGDTDDPATVTVTNIGDAPVQLGTPIVTGPHPDDYTITDDGCDEVELDVDASCEVTIEFAPTGPGTRQAFLEIPDDTPRQGRLVVLVGPGQQPTTIDIDVLDTPIFGPDTVTFEVTVSPIAEGYVTLEHDGFGGRLISSTVHDDPPRTVDRYEFDYAPGHHEIDATFSPHAYYLGSEAAAVEFDIGTSTDLYLEPTTSHGVAVGDTVTLRAFLYTGGPLTGGTLRIREGTNGPIVATASVSGDDPSLEVTVQRPQGTHPYSAAFVPASSSVEPAATTYDLQVIAGARPETTMDSSPLGTGGQEVWTAFSSPTPGATFECSRDGLFWYVCTSPTRFYTNTEGTQTLRVRARATNGLADATPATRLWTYDSTAPQGTVLIEAGAPFVQSRTVTLSLPATDYVPGTSTITTPARVVVSVDGGPEVRSPYAPTKTVTLSATPGLHTVSVWYEDLGNNRSATVTDTVVLDTVAPTTAKPGRAFLKGKSLANGTILTRINWTGADATSGVARYELGQQINGGAWTTVSTTLTKNLTDRPLATEASHRFRVRAVDKAGNVGAWAYGDTFRVSRVSEGNGRITYSGTWSTSKASVFWGGVAKASSRAGARATMTFTGRSVAWIASMGPTRGKAEVYVNGSRVATVDLYSATGKHQQVVWAGSWATSASRTVSIRVLGTSGRPRVDLDAFVTAN